MKPERMKRICLLLCTALAMSSCATIFCGSKTRVTFESPIEPAESAR